MVKVTCRTCGPQASCKCRWSSLVFLHDKKWSLSHGIGWKLQGESSVCLEKGPHVCNIGEWDWLEWVGLWARVGGSSYSLCGDNRLFKGT